MPDLQAENEFDTTAWKAGNNQRRDALRLLIAAIENARIDLGHPLDDEETTKVLQRLQRLVPFLLPGDDGLFAGARAETALRGGPAAGGG